MKGKSNYGDRNQNSGCWRGLIRKGHEGIFWGDGNFLLRDRFVVYMGVYVSHTHWTVHLRSVSLYVNRISLKDPNTKGKKKKKTTSRDGSTFLPSRGSFCPEFNIPMHFNTFITYAYILEQDMVLFCLSLNYICIYITTYIHTHRIFAQRCIRDLSIWYQ